MTVKNTLWLLLALVIITMTVNNPRGTGHIAGMLATQGVRFLDAAATGFSQFLRHL